jgi:hypothetical protein
MNDLNEANGRHLVDLHLYCLNVEREGWVYFVVGGGGAVKVGTASSYQGVRRQITSAQTYAELGIAAVRMIHGGSRMEQELHRRFSDERLRFETPEITGKGIFTSEWFSGPKVNAYIEKLSQIGECEACRSEQLTLFSEAM